MKPKTKLYKKCKIKETENLSTEMQTLTVQDTILNEVNSILLPRNKNMGFRRKSLRTKEINSKKTSLPR